MIAPGTPFGQADLTTCDREIIHLPDAIQPQGILLALDEPNLIVRQASSNSAALCGVAAEELLERPLASFVPGPDLTAFVGALGRMRLEANPLFVATLPFGAAARPFHATVHRIDGVLLVELEPALPPGLAATGDIVSSVREIMSELLRAPDLQTLSRIAAVRVRALSGFDRAWVYRFHEDLHGEVIAEDTAPGLPAYLGLHYPASDIPLPARRLFLMNWIRLIPDACAPPDDLLPAVNPTTGRPLDMSYCALRAVSPIHVEYMTNMGAGASMSLSLIHQGRLWGLLSCQSRDPHQVPRDVRTTCELLAQMVSLQLGAAEAREDADYKLQLRDIAARAVEEMADTDDMEAALPARAETLARFVRADGMAIVSPNTVRLVGHTPPAEAVRALGEWLLTRVAEPVLATDALSTLYPPAAALVDVVAGLLAVQISSLQPTYLLWFRREVIQTVRWGGDPTKEQAEATPHGARIHPRKSFDQWKEIVRGHALPWQPFEIQAARELRHGLLAVVLRHAELEQARLYGAEHQARQALTAERDRLQQVLDVLPEGVVIVDGQGKVVLLNKAGQDLVGRDMRDERFAQSGDEAYVQYGLRRADGTAYPAEDQPLIRSLRHNVVVQGDQELLRQAGTGRDIPLLMNSAPLCAADGTISGAVAVFQDIVALKELERVREAFLSAATHDLKTPLTSIRGLAQLAERRLTRLAVPGVDSVVAQLKTIDAVTRQMAALINVLVDSARLQLGSLLELHPQPTDLVALAHAVAAQHREATERPIRVETNMHALLISVDAGRITRVLDNLVGNAIKYSPAVGLIALGVAREDGPGGPWAVLTVTDQGLGIPAADLPHIFKRHYRASNVTGLIEGTGTGLASVRQIVEQHGGQVAVDSQVGVGTTLRVRLPLGAAASTKEPAPDPGGTAPL